MMWTIVVVAALVVVLVIWQTIQIQAIRKRVSAVPQDENTVALLQTLHERNSANSASIGDLENRLSAVEGRLPYAMSRMGVVSYDAFGNITGNQSRSIALISERGDGLVVTLLTSREETLFYTKEVRAGRGVEGLSDEEQAAIDRALGR